MAYQDLVIASDNGTALEAWYIPAKQTSDKLVIFNHALPMCRSGYPPGHLGLPWSAFDAVEIDFVIQYKNLTDAGYLRYPQSWQQCGGKWWFVWYWKLGVA